MDKRNLYRKIMVFLIVKMLVLHASIPALSYEAARMSGLASWYSESDPHINKYTANGEVFRSSKKTCASWDYAFGSRLKVTNLENGKSVVCVVNDRGPSKRFKNRIIDLSKSSFRQIADAKAGLIRVNLTPLDSTGGY
ncbi:MAG: septal ring lytic transglycosylase RlpA family lipoprotein [Candidatus Omnitrophica bacterium]|nr:septal ring lytic transglycosylase RlpA family lipoprotein [Candidatus Omnitrophota bacterium]